MCPPLLAALPTISASTAAYMSIAATAASFVGGQMNASATADAANANAQAQYRQNALQASQLNEQTAQAMTERQRQAMVAEGHINAVSGESGVQLSADGLQQEQGFASTQDMATLQSNNKAKIQQINAQNQSIQAQTQGSINTAYSKAPTLIGTGLQIAGEVGAYQAKQAVP